MKTIYTILAALTLVVAPVAHDVVDTIHLGGTLGVTHEMLAGKPATPNKILAPTIALVLLSTVIHIYTTPDPDAE